MADATALETDDLVVHGDRSELRLEGGRLSLHKEATTQARPTDVEAEVGEVRGATLEAPPRGGLGWLHVSVVGGSPPPPSGLAAAGDPWTLPITPRALGSARRLVRMVERHVQTRGLPPESPEVGGSSGVVLNPRGALTEKTPYRAPADGADGDHGAVDGAPAAAPDDLVGRLRELADLHAAGALTDDEFQRAKDRLLG